MHFANATTRVMIALWSLYLLIFLSHPISSSEWDWFGSRAMPRSCLHPCSWKGLAHCYKVAFCVPPKYTRKSYPMVHENVTLFGNWLFTAVIKSAVKGPIKLSTFTEGPLCTRNGDFMFMMSSHPYDDPRKWTSLSHLW